MDKPTQLSSSNPARTALHFQALLEEMLQQPERRDELQKEIMSTFSMPRAVLILDMSGFSRITRLHGIVTFLLMIYHMRKICEPAIAKHSGILVKAEADNLYCVFAEAGQAVAAARDMHRLLHEANATLEPDRELHACIGIGFGNTLYVGEEDLFGDEVNLACKLGEDIAEKGDILLTAEAFTRVPEEAARAQKGAVNISGLTLDYWNVR